ncbi:hypothetical protein F511_38595 [Dorcoceras hygrometricum]|uniref:Dystroglycan-like n=1 Tax=Dorcoceras hygrometricum TaxID=472368 RepID=A0A2Z7CQI8_9LAMI|nr:hypothetical protein F511_38595 [Dorcoceras hygrometricum]
MFGAKFTSDVGLTSQILGLNISVVRYQILVFGNISAVELKHSVDGLLFQRLKIYGYQVLVSGFYVNHESNSDVDQGLRNQTLVLITSWRFASAVNMKVPLEEFDPQTKSPILAPVIYEAILVEFFSNASVRDGMVVSTVHGVTVEFSEQLFVETFEIPLEGLPELSEIPKDLVFDARSIVSLSGEPVNMSGMKKEMKFEYRLLCDILAKTISVKAGSFDTLTMEKIMMLTAIICEVKINWNRVLFNILKYMVTAGSRQAKGYAIQISLLLENIPHLELGESSSKILTEKTVHRYVVLNDRL